MLLFTTRWRREAPGASRGNPGEKELRKDPETAEYCSPDYRVRKLGLSKDES